MKTPLYKCRIAAKDSQLTLSRLCGVNKSTISRLERGLTEEPGFKLCKTLALRYSAMGLHMDHVFSPHDYPDFKPKGVASE
jgi:transcriptional regulator with XRE-family HTH domain